MSLDWHWTASPGTGEVYSYSVVHRAPHPAFSTPYVLAVVDLDDGWSMLTNVVGVSPERVRIGLRVKVCFDQVVEGVFLPVFTPLGHDTDR